MHHLARRTSLVGRQPEALRRGSEEGGGEEEGGRRDCNEIVEGEEQRVQNNRRELRGK